MVMGGKGIVVASAETAGLGHSVVAPTLRVANRPIISHVLEALAAAGVSETLILGPEESLTAIRGVLNEEGSLPLPLSFAATEVSDLLDGMTVANSFVGDDACVVHVAEGLLGQPLRPLGELLRPDRPDVLVLRHDGEDREPTLGPVAKLLLEEPEVSGHMSSTSGLAGALVLGPGALRLACQTVHGSAGATLALSSIASQIAPEGGRLLSHRVSWQRYAGDPLDLLEMNRMILDQLAGDPDLTERGDNKIEGRVLIHPTAQIRSSVILGPVIIGPRARIDNAYVGPYTAIGPDVQIEGAEIARSIILDGARIMHVRDRIEASTIGRGARIFRDFALPRAMRIHISEGDELVLN
jgi:glucose-1-phosphate thymidylyltransferase